MARTAVLRAAFLYRAMFARDFISRDRLSPNKLICLQPEDCEYTEYVRAHQVLQQGKVVAVPKVLERGLRVLGCSRSDAPVSLLK